MAAPNRTPLTSKALATLVLCAAVGVFLGVSSYTFVYANGASYLSNNPEACVNCHIMREQFDNWRHASHHAAATCNDCHVPHDLIGKYFAKALHGYRHSKAFTFQDFHEPIRITAADLTIVENNCRRCHEALVQDINGAFSAHSEKADCVHCHSSAGHGQ